MALILGLDIDGNSINGALLRTQIRKAEVVRYLHAALPPPTPDTEEPPPLGVALGELLGGLERPPDQVNVHLDGRRVSLRRVDIPAGAAKRAGEILPFELEPLLPYDVDDGVIDHQPIGTDGDASHLMVAAVPKEELSSHLDELRAAGLEPREVAVGAASLDGLTRLLPELREEGPALIVHVGTTCTDLCVIQKGRCVAARTLSEGMEAIRAGERARLEAALRRTVASVRIQDGIDPKVAYFSGEAVAAPGALEWLGTLLGIEVLQLPLVSLEGVPAETTPRYARAVALAARVLSKEKRLDLRKGEFAAPAASGGFAQHARLIAICAAMVLLSFAFSTYARYAVLDSERDMLQARLGSVTEELFGEQTLSSSRARELLEGGRKVDDPLPAFDAYDVLSAVSELIPSTMKHETQRLDIEIDDEAFEGRFELRGVVESIAERDTIAEKIEEHECFENVDKGTTSPGPGNVGLTYRLEVEIRCPGAPQPSKKKKGSRRGAR